jgi:hypothetical protein
LELDDITDLQAIEIRRVGEGEREYAEVDQVLPVDPGETLGQYGLEAEVARSQRRVLATRSLAVVGPGDDGMARTRGPALTCAFGIRVIDARK